MAVTVKVLYIIAISLLSAEADILQNCTANICDLKTCTSTAQTCTQKCYTSNCAMSCTSQQGCKMYCLNGGCTKLSCDLPKSASYHCIQNCKENCRDMVCKAPVCHPTCLRDNCKMTCDDKDAVGLCVPTCKGRGCFIDVHSTSVEGACDKGSCVVRFSKNTSGYLSCPGGNCTLTCANGTTCRFDGSCPNCTGPVYVDDPFAVSGAKGNTPNFARMIGRDVALLYVYGFLVVCYLLLI